MLCCLCLVIVLLLSCLVLSCLVLSCLFWSCLVVSCLLLSCFVLSCLGLSCVVWCCLVCPFVVWFCAVLSCLILSCRLVSSCVVLYSLASFLSGVFWSCSGLVSDRLDISRLGLFQPVRISCSLPAAVPHHPHHRCCLMPQTLDFARPLCL